MPLRRKKRMSWPTTTLERAYYAALVGQLRDARQTKGISQFEMAERVGVSTRIFCRWETGHALPTAFSLMSWATALGLYIHAAPVPVQPQVSDGKKETS